MTRASLQHRVLDGDRVEVRLSDEFGRTTVAVMAGAVMRAKAWGVLADLDPDGVTDAALGQRPNRRALDDASVTKSTRIILALAGGPMTSQGLHRALADGGRGSRVTSRAGDLVRRGYLRRADPNGAVKGAPAVYGLTELGRARARQLGAIVEEAA